MTWLLMVSALETAANEWQRAKGDPVERLKESKPELHKYLSSLSDDSILKKVAAYVAESLVPISTGLCRIWQNFQGAAADNAGMM